MKAEGTLRPWATTAQRRRSKKFSTSLRTGTAEAHGGSASVELAVNVNGQEYLTLDDGNELQKYFGLGQWSDTN